MEEDEMKNHQTIGYTLLAGLLLAGCNRRDEVKEQLHDLKQAEENSPQVAKSLEQQLASAKADVVRLEEQLALAKQGVTKDVVKERQELNEALNNQQKRVSKEVQEAQGAARAHNEDSEKAREELQRTQPVQQVEARVKTETEVVPSQAPRVETTTQQATIPVETSRLVETKQTGNDQNARERATENPVPPGTTNGQNARRARSAAAPQPVQPATTPAPTMPSSTP